MGTLINCSLIFLGTACLMCALFYLILDKENNSFRNYIFFMGVFSATWILGFDFIGFTRNYTLIKIFRSIGVISISGYIVSLIWMLFTVLNISPKIKTIILSLYIAVSIFTPIPYLYNFNIDGLIDFHGRVTYKIPQDAPKTHFFVYIFAFIICFVSALAWLFSKKEKQNKKMIRILIYAHFFILFSAIPDTILLRMDFPYLPTSCFGIALCYLVLWHSTAMNNALIITIQNISKYIYQAEDINILVFDMNKTLSMANNSSKSFLNLSSTKNLHLEDIFDISKFSSNEIFNSIIKSETYITKINTKTGIPVSLVCNLIKDKKSNPYCIIIYVNDLEKEAAIQRELEKASQAKSNFISHMSHEIRTPINAIIGMNEMILRENTQENIDEYSKMIKQASSSLLSIVNNILDISRIESGKLTLNNTSYILKDLINESVNMIRERADRKGIKINAEYFPNCPEELYGDSIKIKQILTNLLTNAVKYTDKGYVSIKAGGEKTNDIFLLQITVSDTGRGISKENISKLFKPFERLDMDQNTTIEGTGLGLNITKKFIDAMDGEISVESQLNKGSEFTVTIPQVIQNESVPQNSRNIPKKAEPYKYICPYTAPEAKILVIDDTEINLKVFTSLIKETKIQTDTALSGMEGLTKALEKNYDIIFLDHMMPGMDGIETLKQMRTHPELNNVPVIILTANTVQGMREKFLSEGFTDFVSKPIDYKILEEMIKKYLPEAKVTLNQINDSNNKTDDIEPLAAYDFSKISPEKLSKALNNCAGNEKLLNECIKDFFNPHRMEEIEKLYAEKNIKNYAIKVHSVKSSARLLGFDTLSEFAETLQKNAESGDWNQIEELHKIFIKEWKNLF